MMEQRGDGDVRDKVRGCLLGVAVGDALALLSLLRGEPGVPAPLGEPGVPVPGAAAGFEALERYRGVRRAGVEATHPTTGLFMWRQVLERGLGLTPGRSTWAGLPPFEEGILTVVNGSFDKDTAGAVGGALLEARWGEGGIPERWRRRVWRAKRIVALADQLPDSVRPEG